VSNKPKDYIKQTNIYSAILIKGQ